MFWGMWKATVDRQSFLGSSGSFSPPSPWQLQLFADLWEWPLIGQPSWPTSYRYCLWCSYDCPVRKSLHWLDIRLLLPQPLNPENDGDTVSCWKIAISHRLWSSTAIHQWRGIHCLFKDVGVGNLHTAFSMWLPAPVCLTSLPGFFWNLPWYFHPFPPPSLQTRSEAINWETMMTCRLSSSIEGRRTFSFPVNFCGYSRRTQHISWKMRGQGLPNYRVLTPPMCGSFFEP